MECRHCRRPLLSENLVLADGCECNSKRGINHGIVDTLTCTCRACDPAETGGSRFVSMPSIESFIELGEGRYAVRGKCACGGRAVMTWAFMMMADDGTFIPRCDNCARRGTTGRYVEISKEIFDYFTALHVMNS